MSAPTIQLVESLPMVDTKFDNMTNGKMEYLLYADNRAFATFVDWVNDPTSQTSANEKFNASKFSNYVLKLRCKLSKQGEACGIKHPTHGAFMISSDTANGSIEPT